MAFLTVYRRVDRATGERIETGRPLTHGYLRQAVAAIGYRHTLAGHPDPTSDPTIAVLLEGYGKTYGTASNGKDPLRVAQLGAICLTLSQPAPTATRDLALALQQVRSKDVGVDNDDRRTSHHYAVMATQNASSSSSVRSSMTSSSRGG